MENKFKSAKIGEKWVVFKQDADLSDFDETKIVEWSIGSKECNTGSIIETVEKITVSPESPAFRMAYDLSFSEVHMTKVEGPKASEKPDKAFIQALPMAVVTAFVSRVDSTRQVTEPEMEGLKKPKPSAETNGDSASS